MGYKKR